VRPAPAEFAARVHHAGSDEANSRILRRRLLEVIARSVPHDAYSWLLTDPETTVGPSPLAEVPCLARLHELVRLRYTTGPRWDPHAGVRIFATSPRGAWHAFVADYGVRDVASVSFGDRFGCWGFLDLWRDSPFTEDEVALLASLVAPVTDLLRRNQAAALRRVTSSLRASGPVVLLLAPSLEVRLQTEESEAVMRKLLPTEASRRPVPAGAYNVAAQLLAVEAGIDEHPAWARVHVEEEGWLSFRAARLGGHDGDIAVTLEPLSANDRLSLFARSHALSKREVAVIGCLAEGNDTRHVATRLKVSEHTVQDHLKSVSAKTGLRSRVALLAAAVGGR